MAELEKDCESICDNPLTPPRRPLGDYVDEYNRISERILELECQISMLEKNRQQLNIAAFDQHIYQLYVELCTLKIEIEPIARLLCEVISREVIEEDKEYLVEQIFLRHSIREIAVSHNTTSQRVLHCVSRSNRLPVPERIAEKYGKILKE